jgi:hypothetical protein
MYGWYNALNRISLPNTKRLRDRRGKHFDEDLHNSYCSPLTTGARVLNRMIVAHIGCDNQTQVGIIQRKHHLRDLVVDVCTRYFKEWDMKASTRLSVPPMAYYRDGIFPHHLQRYKLQLLKIEPVPSR